MRPDYAGNDDPVAMTGWEFPDGSDCRTATAPHSLDWLRPDRSIPGHDLIVHDPGHFGFTVLDVPGRNAVAVLSHPARPGSIFKIVNRDDAFLEYARFCMEDLDDLSEIPAFRDLLGHFLNIYGIWDICGKYHLIEMERLEPAAITGYHMDTLDEIAWEANNTLMGYPSGFPLESGLTRAARLLHDTFGPDALGVDLHAGNLMARRETRVTGGELTRLVILDPYSTYLTC